MFQNKSWSRVYHDPASAMANGFLAEMTKDVDFLPLTSRYPTELRSSRSIALAH
jgi:hypothetical protein